MAANGWTTRSLGELTDNFDAQRIPVKERDRKRGPYPYYGASGVVDHVDEYIFDGEYLLIAEDGENLRTCQTPIAFLARGKFWVNNHAHIVRGNGDADTRFLMYALRNNDISGYLTGSTMPKLTQGNMNRIPILAPPLSEQRAIAGVLGALEAIAQAQFRRMMEDGGNWKTGKLSDLCSTQYGFTASATDEPVGPKFLRVMDINKQNWIEWSSVPHCEISGEDKSKYALAIGDIVVARMADPGKSAIIEQEIDAIFASYLVRLKTESLAHAYYVYGFLKSQDYRDYSEGAMSGSVQANMNAKVIVAAELPIPPVTVMEAHLKKVLPLRQRIVANLQESQTLAALRDALLPKLLSGAVRVRRMDTVDRSGRGETKENSR